MRHTRDSIALPTPTLILTYIIFLQGTWASSSNSTIIQESLGLFIHGPEIQIFPISYSTTADIYINVTAEVGDWETCINEVYGYTWANTKFSNLIPNLQLLNSTLLNIRQSFKDMEQRVDFPNFIHWLLNQNPATNSTCLIEWNYLELMSIPTWKDACSIFKTFLYDDRSRMVEQIAAAFVGEANTLYWTLAKQLTSANMHLQHSLEVLQELKYGKFPEMWKSKLQSCLQTEDFTVTITSCSSQNTHIRCHLLLAHLDVPFLATTLYPIPYNTFIAQLPFKQSAVHHQTKTIVDLSNCRAVLSSNNMHCGAIAYRHSDCYLQDIANSNIKLLDVCTFLAPNSDKTHFPFTAASGALLFSNQHSGTLSIGNKTYNERPLLVDGLNLTYKVFESLQNFQLLGPPVIKTTRFDKETMKHFKQAISIFFPQIKLHWPGILTSQALSIACYALTFAVYLIYVKLCRPKSSQANTSTKTRPSTNLSRREVRRQKERLLQETAA